jgi:flagellin
MSVINTNTKALFAQAALKTSARELTVAMEQLSTGKRINSARDDAAGLAIADRMTQQIRSLNQAVRNAGDAISLIQTAEGATGEISDMLQRMRELAIQAINDTNAGEQRAYLDLEFQQLKQEIVRIADTTEWNGFSILNGTVGIPQGEMPVYKVESEPLIELSPTFASRVGSVQDAREQQVVTFSAAPNAEDTVMFDGSDEYGRMTITVEGLNAIEFDVNDSADATDVAASAAAALNQDTAFVTAGRLAIDNGDGSVTIRYAASDAIPRSVPIVAIVDATDATAALAQTAGYVASTTPETQTITFTAGTTQGWMNLAMDGTQTYFYVEAGDTAIEMGAAAAAALSANPLVNAKGWTVTDNTDGTVDVTFLLADGDVSLGSGTAVATEATGWAANRTGAGTIAETLTFTGATTDGYLRLEVNVIDPDAPIVVGAEVRASDTAAQVGARVALAANQTSAFAAQGLVAIDNGDGTVTIVTSPANAESTDVTLLTSTTVTDTQTDATGVFTDNHVPNGVGQAEVQRVTFTAATTTGYLRLVANGVTWDVLAEEGDTAAEIATAAKTALDATLAEAGITTWTTTDNGDDTLDVEFPLADGDVAVGTDGEQLKSDATGTAAAYAEAETVTVGGVAVEVTAGDSAVVVATAAGAALNAGAFVQNNAGRVVSDNLDGTLTITYLADDDDVADLSFTDTDATGVTRSVTTTTVGDITATLTDGGALAKAGDLTLSINPDQLEKHRIVFGPATAAQNITVGGVVVTTVSAGDTSQEVALKVQAALLADSAYALESGRVITNHSDGSLTITYAAVDGAAGLMSYEDTGTSGVTASVFREQSYATVSATMDVDDGDPVALVGALDTSSGVVTFYDEAVAQGDTLTLSGTFKETDVLTVTVNGQTLEYTVTAADALDTGTLAGNLTQAINAEAKLGQYLTASVNRDDTISLLSDVAGTGFLAYATVARVGASSTAEVSSTTTTQNVSAGDNAKVLSGNLILTVVSDEGSIQDLTYRELNARLRVDRSFSDLPDLRTGDLVINGVTVGPSRADDDELSAVSAASSAIAKAAAINRVSGQTNVQAVVGETVLTGSAMAPSAALNGTVTINGYTSPVIRTIESNTKATRDAVVEAINRMSDRTGVVAKDDGADELGVSLRAADGRNISIYFNSDSSVEAFATATGLRQGLTSANISLESKVEQDVVLGTSTTGDISRVGFSSGDFSKNETAMLGRDRTPVQGPIPQVTSLAIDGTISSGDSFTLTINGRTVSVTAESASLSELREAIVSAVEADATIASTVSIAMGESLDSIYLTSMTPGVSFTIQASTTSNAAYTDLSEVQASQGVQAHRLNTADLVLNGVEIGGSVSSSDIRTSEVAASSLANGSGLAIAAAINAKSDQTGVRATVDPGEIRGSSTVSGKPGLFPNVGPLPLTGAQSLFINGIEVEVQLTVGESLDVRRDNVVAAVNRKLDTHGIQASNNGSGVTLTAIDGRNMSVWFDASVPGLSAADFGLGTGDEIAQRSEITVTDADTTTEDFTVSVEINGVTVTSSTISAGASDAIVAAAIQSAIEDELNAGTLTNLVLSRDGGELAVSSLVPGSPFTLTGLNATTDGLGMQARTAVSNGVGGGVVTGIVGADRFSGGAVTLYSGVKLISDEEFTVEAGGNGYTSDGAFRSLGFVEGTFGGRSSAEMSPPRVGRLTFQVGAQVNQSIHIDLADFGSRGNITGSITDDVELSETDERSHRIDTRAEAEKVLENLDIALDRVNATRGTMGAVMNRLDHTIDNLLNVSINTEASRSQIEDADYAAASTEMARTQIMQQAATAVLAQANASQQNVLSLLQ